MLLKSHSSRIIILGLSACMLLSAAAAEKNASASYESLVADGSAEDITAALKNDNDLVTYTIGTDGDTLLMGAIKAGRDKSIIKLLLDAGISPAKKNRHGQSAVSYACMYCPDAYTASMVITYGTVSSKQVRARLMTKDKDKKYAAEYVADNKSEEVKQLVQSFLTDKDKELLSDIFGTPAGQDSAAGTAPDGAPAAAEAPAGTPALPAADAAPVPAAAAATAAPVPDSVPASVTAAAASQTPVQPQQPVSAYKKASLYDYASDDDGSKEDEADGQGFQRIAEPNAADGSGVTPLMTAVKNGNDWDVDALLYSGADVNAKDKEGWTPLMYAVRYQNSEKLVSTLIGRGAEIKVQNKYGITPLVLAAQYSENPSVLAHLLSAYTAGETEVFKALVCSITGSGSAVSDRVLTAKIQLFLEKGTPLNRFWEGKTPLMYAAQSCSTTEAIDQLLSGGALTGTRTADGKTAFDFARSNTRLPRDHTYWSLNTER